MTKIFTNFYWHDSQSTLTCIFHDLVYESNSRQKFNSVVYLRRLFISDFPALLSGANVASVFQTLCVSTSCSEFSV